MTTLTRLTSALRREDNYIWEALGASLALHLLLFHAGDIGARLPKKREVELDITNMRMSAPAEPRPPQPRAPAPPKPAAPPKQWLQSAPGQKVAPAAAPTKPVPQEAPPPPPPPAEIGVGTGDGRQLQLARLPQLLNLSDLAAIQQRFYPEDAREDGRQATVVLDIHIGGDGRVTGVEIVQSTDPEFDQPAIHVAQLLRFTPAYLADRPVAVKMRQAIQFKLQR